MAGRKLHNYWEVGEFEAVKLENGRNGALCKVCSGVLKNTSKQRLLTHRKLCVPLPENKSGNNSASSNATQSPRTQTNLTASPSTSFTGSKLPNFNSSISNIEEVIFVPDTENIPTTEWTEIQFAGPEEEILNLINSTDTSVYFQPHNDPKKSQISSCSGSTQNTNDWPSTSTVTTSCSDCESSVEVSSLERCSSSCSNHSLKRNVYISPQMPKKKLKEKNQSAKLFMDSMNVTEKKNIDTELGNFFFGCNIPFAVVESDHFKRFLKALRPSYNPPTRKTLSNTVLDDVYNKIKATDSNKPNEEGVLLIDGWKNSSANSSNVVTLLQTANGTRKFVESFDFTEISETGEELAQACTDSIEIAKTKYNAEVYAVVSDNAKNMMKMGQILKNMKISHSTCNSHTGNLLAKDITDQKISEKVVMVLKCFKNRSDLERKLITSGGCKIYLPAQTRWCSQRNSFSNFIRNLKYMRMLAVDDGNKIKAEVRQLLYDEDFVSSVEKQIETLDPICELINTCQNNDTSLADAAELWLKIKVPDKFADALEKRKKMALNVNALVAHKLHPIYRGQLQSRSQQSEVDLYLLKNLSSEGLNDFEAFNSGSEIFSVLNEKLRPSEEKSTTTITPITYWRFASRNHPTISKLALRMVSIPASSASIERLFSNWSYVHSSVRNRLEAERSKKLVDIYYSLKLKDNNITDEY